MKVKTVIKLKYNKIYRPRLTVYSVLYFLLVITPIMDTINGWYVLGHGETGVSIGTFYRLFILLYIFFCFRFNRKDWTWLCIAAYFPISSAIRAFLSNISFMSAFTYGLKWMLPMIYILLFTEIRGRYPYNIPRKIMDVWKYIIPSLLIVEYILGIGADAYFDAGFRGLFYCTNDIGFSLTMMSIYSLYTCILQKINIRNLLPVILNLIAILILSTKSCIIFTAITILFFLLKKFLKSIVSIIPVSIILISSSFVLFYMMNDNIANIISRYVMFFSQTVGNGLTFHNLMGFLTSARTYRIADTINRLLLDFSIPKVFFGWCEPVFTGAIEMDWLDAIFQHGILGFIILLFFYCNRVFNRKYQKIFRYMLAIAMVCAAFSGHVINGALPSTVFSIVVGCAIFSKQKSGL